MTFNKTGTPDAVTKRLAERSDGANLSSDGTIYGEEFRFCWIDEDGARVSPVHGDFGKALSWVSDWPAHNARLRDRKADLEAETIVIDGDSKFDYRRNSLASDLERVEKALVKISLTGKPPVSLRRLVIRTTVESLEEYEAITVENTLDVLGLAE